LYTAEIPEGWRLVQDATTKSDGEETLVRSRWEGPAGVSLTIDAVEGDTQTGYENAQVVNDALEDRPGVKDLTFDAFGAANVVRLEWREQGETKIDYFRDADQCAGYAVLGAAQTGVMNRYRSTFRTVADSIRPECTSPGGESDAGPQPAADSYGQLVDQATGERTCGIIEVRGGKQLVVRTDGEAKPRCGEARSMIQQTYGVENAPEVNGWFCSQYTGAEGTVDRGFAWGCSELDGIVNAYDRGA
jgi:hypothetical protein